MENSNKLNNLDKRLQLIENKEAILDLLSRYALLFNMGRLEEWYTLWAEDLFFSFHDNEGQIRDCRGKMELKSLFGTNPAYTTSQHLQINPTIKINADTASVICFQAISQHKNINPNFRKTSVRFWRLLKINDEWRITEGISRDMKYEDDCKKLIPDNC